MDPVAILALYDREMRADPADSTGATFERGPELVRELGPSETIVYARLDHATAVRAVEAEARRCRTLGRELEWKVYEHDRPSELPALLERAGFHPDEPETLVAMDLGSPMVSPRLGDQVRVGEVTGERAWDDAVRVSREAFGPDGARTLERFRGRLDDPSARIFVAYAGDRPVSVGRLELPPGRSFASLWGGGTVPQFRGRGVYREMVRVRAELARSRGYKFLTVDARETSRPILERLEFIRLARVQGWVMTPGGPGGERSSRRSTPPGTREVRERS